MNDTETEGPGKELVLEYELDAPSGKVWRAISIPAFREMWLPDSALADAEPVFSRQDEEIRYRMRDDQPPFLESEVTFRVSPNATGGSVLKIIHRLLDARSKDYSPEAANDDQPFLMLAA